MKDQQAVRPATLEDVKLLVNALNEAGAEYVLIGGYALYAHGYRRTTEDIDILIPKNRMAGEVVKQALLKLPDKAAKDIDTAWIEQGETIRVVDEFVIDLLMNACGETYESLKDFIEIIDLDGIPVKTLDLEGLIRTKESTREKDKMDFMILKKALAESKKNR